MLSPGGFVEITFGIVTSGHRRFLINEDGVKSYYEVINDPPLMPHRASSTFTRNTPSTRRALTVARKVTLTPVAPT